MNSNIHLATVEGFGDEWQRFDQSKLPEAEHKKLFDEYFAVFPWDKLPKNAKGFDLGCGSGRWAKLVAPLVAELHCIDPSAAIEVAKRNLSGFNNCIFHNSAAYDMQLADNSMDFGYSLGVLHHIPDTQAAMASCVRKLKTGAPFLVYLYYAFDNRPLWFKCIWKTSEFFRYVISRLPHNMRYLLSQFIAAFIYFPIARIAYLLEKCGINVSNIPLSAYRDASFYTMRTDALDRFGTRLEQRFTRAQIQAMMEKSGLRDIKFSDNVPFWCAVGYKAY